jgi:hypothetical protein
MSKFSVDGKRWRKQRLKGKSRVTLSNITMVKNDDPIPKDVVKAAANVSGYDLTNNQGYHVIKADEESNFFRGKRII